MSHVPSESLTRDIDALRARGTRDSVTLRQELADRVRRAVPFNGFCFHTADPVSLVTSGVVTGGVDASKGSQVIDHEYFAADFLKHRRLAAGPQHVGTLAVATGGDPRRSPRWRLVLGPDGVVDELRAALVARGVCWGYLHLFRSRGHRPFDAGEVATITDVVDPMAACLRQSYVDRAGAAEEPGAGAPGLLLLSGSGEPAYVSAEADRWLRQIRPVVWNARLPEPIAEIVDAAQANDRLGRPRHETRVTMAVGGHRWLTAEAIWCANPRSADGTDGRVSVLLHPASTSDIADRLMTAHLLTPGQRRVVELVRRGLSTRQMAARLNLSEYTVQDRLKVVYGRLGVRSRPALMAALTGEADGRT